MTFLTTLAGNHPSVLKLTWLNELPMEPVQNCRGPERERLALRDGACIKLQIGILESRRFEEHKYDHTYEIHINTKISMTKLKSISEKYVSIAILSDFINFRRACFSLFSPSSLIWRKKY